MLKTDLKIPFIWYNAKSKQHRYRQQNETMQPWGILTGQQRFLPFQIKGVWDEDNEFGAWKIYRADDVLIIDISAQVSNIEVKHTETNEWLTYKADVDVFDLEPGFYYSTLQRAGITYYSEVFQVVDYIDQCMFIEWYNSSDIEPLMYQTGYKNRLYLDLGNYTEPIAAELIEEGVENGIGEFQPTLQSIAHKHKIEALLPDYILDALLMLDMHDSLIVSEGGDTVSMNNIKATMDYGENYLGTAKIEFELPRAYIKTACGKNIELVS